MDVEMSRRIKPKEKYVCILMKEIWRNLDLGIKSNMHKYCYYSTEHLVKKENKRKQKKPFKETAV